jgi:hypothetical protein
MSDEAPTEDAAWARLDAELAAWRAAGRTATLWWRDDDAGDALVPLLRLLALSELAEVPLVLAAVPAAVTKDLAEAVASRRFTTVVQHGYAHANHAPAGAKKAELGPERPAAVVVAELAAGWQALERHFGARFFPALVPPWNRMAPYLPPYLAEMRYRGVSQFGPRARARPAGALVQVNTHTDIVHWKDVRPRFAGAVKSLDGLTEHLAARRSGGADPDEPTGILTHHLAHDVGCWRFLDRLVLHLRDHPAVAFLPAEAVFAAPPSVRLAVVPA